MAVGETTAALIGREKELALAAEALTATPTVGGVVAISGDPGIGKTRLLAELLEGAVDERRLVLEGRAAELERDIPFAVVVDALDAHVASLRRAEMSALAPDVLAELGRVLPSLADRGDGAAGALQDERYVAYRAIRALLERLALTRPLVLAIDDLQWADPASTELICHLLDRGPGRNVVLVVAFRAGQVAPRVSWALEACEREGRAALIELEPFTRANVETWCGDRLDMSARQLIHELSGGNPFYLEQLLRTWGSASTTPGPSAPGRVPSAIRATIETELDGLGETERLVLEGGAVAGDPFEPDIAAAAAGVDEATALDAIDVLAERRLVVDTAIPRRFAFRHPIVREAVYETSGGGWRLAAHGRAADALATRGASPAERAHHVERAAARGDLDAIDLLAAAAEEARPRAPATAARWLGSALRLTPAGDDGRRLGLLMLRALSLASAGELEDCRAAALEALALVGDEPTPMRVRLVVVVAQVEVLLGSDADALARVRAALDELPDEAAEGAAMLHLALAIQGLALAEYDGALAAACRARDIAEPVGDRALLAATTGAVAVTEAFAARVDAESRHTLAASELLDGLDDGALAARIEAAFLAGYGAYHYERYQPAAEHLQRGIAVSRATGQGQMLVPMGIGLALALERQGRPREALEHIDAAVEGARLTGNAVWLTWGLGMAAWLHAQLGDVSAALRAGEAALVSARAHDPVVYTAGAGLAYGMALIDSGEPERGRALMLDLCGGPDLPHMVPPGRAVGYDALVQADLAAGRVDAAQDWVDRGIALAASIPFTGLGAIVQRTRARIALHENDAATAVELARASAAGASAVGMRIEAARSELLAGQAGDDADAVAHAEAELAACGGELFRRQAAGVLRRLGRRAPQRAAGANDGDALAGLTVRQQEIARLVADGRTNREIAGVLVVTEKTVENHLARMFARLGVSSRAALAAAISRDGAQS